MRSKSWAGGLTLSLIVAVALGLIGYLATGPYRTMRDFSDALAARDSAALATYVDFPKLRQSIKSQLTQSVEQHRRAEFADNPVAALAAGLAVGMSDTLVESLVTPSGLEKLLAGERLFAALDGSSKRPTYDGPLMLKNARYSYLSLSEFVVTLEPKPSVQIALILEREGLSWKISGVKLSQ